MTGAILLVEGADDKRVLSDHCHVQRRSIFASEGRNDLVLALIEIKKRNVRGVLGIADADFSRLDGSLISLPNLIYTDGHDLEGLFFSSRAVLKTLNHFGSLDKILQIESRAKKRIAAVLYDLAYPIGLMRYLSLRDKINLDFDKMEVSHFFELGNTRVRRISND